MGSGRPLEAVPLERLVYVGGGWGAEKAIGALALFKQEATTSEQPCLA